MSLVCVLMKPSTSTVCITGIDIQQEVFITTDMEQKEDEFQDTEECMNTIL